MDIRHLPAQSRLARPWRNGGGVTSDIAVFPDDSGDDGFQWRASIATITDAGPFSSWPGVDRTLLVLRGQLTLGTEARGEMQLDEWTSAFAFAGEDQVVARPLGTPCLVLNLMIRRGQTRFRLRRQSNALPIVADQTLLLATQSTTISVNGLSIPLDERDALLFGPDRASSLEIDRTVIVMEFSNISAGSS
jgi:environmental stress-induced protein Ves